MPSSNERLTPLDYFCGIYPEFNDISDFQLKKIENIRNLIRESDKVSTLENILHSSLGNHDVQSESHSYRASQNAYETFFQIDADFCQKFDPEDIKIGALLYDVGKICVDQEILKKTEALTKCEVEKIKMHTFFSFKILKNLPKISNTVLNISLYHHEKWDGTGYPYGIKGEKIPLETRIFSIIDVWDALISERSYRKALPHKTALEMLMGDKFAGHFDPKIIKAFIKSKKYLLSSPSKNSDQSPLGSDLILQSLA